MLSKVIYFIGAVIAMGLTWFFVLVFIADSCCSYVPEGYVLIGAVVICFAVASVPAWRLFINPTKRAS